MGKVEWVVGRGLAAALTPSLRSVTFTERGFPGRHSAACLQLERIPQTVLCGFEWSLGSRDHWELERRLELVEPDNRGFAYEGAAMGALLLVVMLPGKGSRTVKVMSGPGRRHALLNLIGIGFAMARLPRFTWSKIPAHLPDGPYPEWARWLVVDGYGFDLAYFDSARWLDRQVRPSPHAWLGDSDYFLRAADQGMGRALWFVCGGSVPDVAAAVGRFASDRRPDLWSGVGLAATFAGGGTTDSLEALVRRAGDHAPHLRQGAAFAARARVDAGHVPAFTEAAALALTGVPTNALAELVHASVEHAASRTDGWERTRSWVRDRLTAVGVS